MVCSGITLPWVQLPDPSILPVPISKPYFPHLKHGNNVYRTALLWIKWDNRWKRSAQYLAQSKYSLEVDWCLFISSFYFLFYLFALLSTISTLHWGNDKKNIFVSFMGCHSLCYVWPLLVRMTVPGFAGVLFFWAMQRI